MWHVSIPVAVWQPCELLYTCYLLTYLLTGAEAVGAGGREAVQDVADRRQSRPASPLLAARQAGASPRHGADDRAAAEDERARRPAAGGVRARRRADARRHRQDPRRGATQGGARPLLTTHETLRGPE